MHPSWEPILSEEFSSSSFSDLLSFLASERVKHEIFPSAENVFNAFNLPFDDVKVVIVGQDPYHQPNQAHGLSFSVLPPTPPPPSLANIFKELEADIDGWKRPSHGNLTAWANQGVFLLNTILTVRRGEPLSHKNKGWERITERAVTELSNRGQCVFVLWGKPAQRLQGFIDADKNEVLIAPHPSPLSAHTGFFGSKPFSKINHILESYGKGPIDWQLV
jgi:uracil-DNA glycosylase